MAERTCRDEVLEAARRLATASIDGTFSPEEVIQLLRRMGSSYKDSTIRTHMISRMCANAPSNHAVRYPDLVRDSHGRYRLNDINEVGR
ncbi:DUF7669 domain-containing protein [Lentzea californiensis]|uniref:DUF7669 domain-containing protein n=1 Tax=Lentzea californiensis TaxID=438851 RepID=UPI0021649585|nr:hypothetical protein [Lentzea californiensis]